MRIMLGWKSWVWRVLALLVIVTFPFWWAVLWGDLRRLGRDGFWATGWTLFASTVREIVTGED